MSDRGELCNSRFTPSCTRYQRLKFILDFVVALALVIVLWPFLLLIAVIVRLDSPGSPIYRQLRVGSHGATFTMFKFRSMRTDTPTLSTEEMNRLNQDHTTRVGRLLRKTSLDELPQLFNILKGEMSFVGPRPALPSQTPVNSRRAELGVDVLRPGITGLAQVKGRDDLDDESKVNLDAEYSSKVSLLFDLSLIWSTFAAVLSARGNK